MEAWSGNFVFDSPKHRFESLSKTALESKSTSDISNVLAPGRLILLRPKIGLAPKKHCVISMPRQQYTNTKHIPIKSYYHVVFIMLRYMDKKNHRWKFLMLRSENRQNHWEGGGTYRIFLSNATTFGYDCGNKRSVRMKHIYKPRKSKCNLGIDHTDFETPENPHKE